MNRAKYYISFNAGILWTEFFPSNEPKLNLTREGDEMFKRWRVDKFRIARIKNTGVFDTLHAMFFDPLYFGTDIKYKINILGTDKFYFIDPVTSIQLDSQNMVYEATPEPDDAYRPILQQYEKKWQQRTANTLFSHSDTFFYNIIDSGFFTNVDFSVFGDSSRTVTWENNAGGATQYARNLLAGGNFVGSIITIIIKNYAGDPFSLRLVDQTFTAISATIDVTANGKYQLTQTGVAVNAYLEMLADNAANISGSYYYEAFYAITVTSGGLFHDVITDILNNASYMNLGLTIDSTILWNDTLPTNPPSAIDTYITANPTNDYVIEAAAIWNYLWLARTDSFTTAKEDILEYSLKDIMYLLRKIRMWWFIDDDGHFRIEHDRYFREFTAQADLTSVTYAPDKPEVDQKVYRYERSDSYNQLNYSEENQDHEDWMAFPVNFPISQTSKSTKDISFSELTTDFEYVRDNPGTASSTGLMLLRTESTLNMVEIDQSTITPTNYYSNARLSWAWLFANYYDYFAEAETGTINNGTAITYTHVKEYLKQGNIRFRMAADMDWKRPFTLSQGTGWLEGAEYAPETGMYKIDVAFDPYHVVVYIVDEDMSIFLTDEDGTTLLIA
jgi:hypothetical protein